MALDEQGVRIERRPRDPAPPDAEPWSTPHRSFIPVELLGPVTPPDPAAEDGPVEAAPMPLIVADLDESWSERTSLFGDLDR